MRLVKKVHESLIGHWQGSQLSWKINNYLGIGRTYVKELQAAMLRGQIESAGRSGHKNKLFDINLVRFILRYLFCLSLAKFFGLFYWKSFLPLINKIDEI